MPVAGNIFASDLSKNVDALSCRRQSFRQVWYKSAIDCMRNANKYPKITHSAMHNEENKKVIRNPRTVIWITIKS